jgi:ribosomal protein S18 acetylase RimI-like enzyme
MIRPAATNDMPDVVQLATKTGLFDTSQIVEFVKILDAYFDAPDGRGFWIVSTGSGVVGAAYCEREQMTISTWNLLWVAIAPEHQRQGHGRALLKRVERDLANLGAYQLLIETSGSLPDSQAFYRDCGYEQEGRIRDFYEPGSDKVIFRKVLAQASGIDSRGEVPTTVSE